MSYHIYTTKGLILSARPIKEADRVYSILTRDLGLVRAIALGVRKETSKLRGALEPVSFSTISLVKGKEHWRITSGELLERLTLVPEIVKPLLLLEKLVQGEDPHPELFDIIEGVLDTKDKRDEMFETQLVAKILYQLGYLEKSDLYLDKKHLIQAINNGIQSSQLV